MSAPNLIDLAVQIAETEESLAALDEFETLWAGFAETLKQIVDACAGTESIYSKPEVRPLLTKADKIREQLRARRSRALGSFSSTALAVLLDTSIRADDQMRLRSLFAEREVHGLDPFGYERDELYIVSPERLDVTLGECGSVFIEKRHGLDAQLRRLKTTYAAAERAQPEERDHARIPQLAAAPEVTLQALVAKWIGRIPLRWLRRFLWSALIDHVKALAGGLIFLLLVAGAYHFFPGVARTVTSWWGHVTNATHVAPH